MGLGLKMIEQGYNKDGKLVRELFVTEEGVVLNGEVIAPRRITKDRVSYGFLGSYSTQAKASALIKKRRDVFGNQYLHTTRPVAGTFLVYVGSNPRFKGY